MFANLMSNVNMKEAMLELELMTPAQCRGARAMLEWSREQLGVAAGISERTITDFERGARKMIRRNQAAVRLALEAGGATFFTFNGTIGVGVKRPDQPPPS